MREHQGVWFPDTEHHMLDWMTRNGEMVDGRGTYQIKKLRAALGYCREFRTAVDIGAHCGLWSMQLAKIFQHVCAFEPMEDHRECFSRNLNGNENVELHSCALGEVDDSVCLMMQDANSTGSTRINGPGPVPLRRLDEFALVGVSFMKLDCEGYELFALRGAAETINGNKPVIIVEQKPGRAQRYGLPETGAVDFLQGLGYRLAQAMSGDYIMVPE